MESFQIVIPGAPRLQLEPRTDAGQLAREADHALKQLDQALIDGGASLCGRCRRPISAPTWECTNCGPAALWTRAASDARAYGLDKIYQLGGQPVEFTPPRRRHPLNPMTARGSTSARGYGHQHQLKREAYGRLVAAGGVRCNRCGEVIRPGTPWDLDHADHPLARAQGWYRGAAHRTCNRGHRKAQPRKPISRFFDV